LGQLLDRTGIEFGITPQNLGVLRSRRGFLKAMKQIREKAVFVLRGQEIGLSLDLAQGDHGRELTRRSDCIKSGGLVRMDLEEVFRRDFGLTIQVA
jgi:hypothetical protein